MNKVKTRGREPTTIRCPDCGGKIPKDDYKKHIVVCKDLEILRSEKNEPRRKDKKIGEKGKNA